MALDTYANLQTAIANRVDRTDLTSEIQDAITIAETEIYRWLRVLWNQKRSYAVPTGAYISLPLAVDGEYVGLESIQYTEGGYRYTLEQLSPHLLDQVSPSTSAGVPRYYAIHDNQIEFRPAFSASNTTEVEITYYYKPSVLSATNTTNELLDNAPDLLFYRVVAEVFDHTFDEQRAAKYFSMYQNIKDQLMNNDVKDRWSGTPLRVRVDSLDAI